MLLALVVLVVVFIMVSLAALFSSRRAARKLEDLSHSYWEVRYDLTRLRSQVARLDPEQHAGGGNPEPSPPPAQVAFVPLSSLRPGQPKDG